MNETKDNHGVPQITVLDLIINLIIIKVFNYRANTTYNVPYTTQAVKV